MYGNQRAVVTSCCIELSFREVSTRYELANSEDAGTAKIILCIQAAA